MSKEQNIEGLMLTKDDINRIALEYAGMIATSNPIKEWNYTELMLKVAEAQTAKFKGYILPPATPEGMLLTNDEIEEMVITRVFTQYTWSQADVCEMVAKAQATKSAAYYQSKVPATPDELREQVIGEIDTWLDSTDIAPFTLAQSIIPIVQGYGQRQESPTRRRDFLKLPMIERRRILNAEVEELNRAIADSNLKEDLGNDGGCR